MVSPHNAYVEIHWALTTPYSVYSFDVPGVFDRAVDLKVGRQPALVAGAADQILQGVYQHIAEGFLDLKRILDLVLVLKDIQEEDWLYLVKENQRTRMAVALGQSLKIYQTLLGLAVPTEVLNQLAPGSMAGRIYWPREIRNSEDLKHPMPLESVFRRWKLGFYHFRRLFGLSPRIIRAFASG